MNEPKPIIENGIVAGNVYDKYKTKNPVAKILMAGFTRAVEELVDQVQPESIHEIGCGEGYLSEILADKCQKIQASDFSSQVIDKARTLAQESPHLQKIDFKIANVYDLNEDQDSAELIVCCEVLEHLEDPRRALKIIRSLACPHAIFSVPREPIWRFLNMCRGKYLGDLGNTPGHLQHWSKNGFLKFISEEFDIIQSRSPLPWTVVLARKKSER